MVHVTSPPSLSLLFFGSTPELVSLEVRRTFSFILNFSYHDIIFLLKKVSLKDVILKRTLIFNVIAYFFPFYVCSSCHVYYFIAVVSSFHQRLQSREGIDQNPSSRSRNWTDLEIYPRHVTPTNCYIPKKIKFINSYDYVILLQRKFSKF